MLFTSTVVLVFSTLTYVVVAQSTTSNENPITYPLGGSFEAGNDITITWTPTFGDSCDLTLRSGQETDLDRVQTIATGIPNSAAFTWSVPDNLSRGNDYSIEISCDGQVNYSPQFSISSDVTSTSSLSSSRSSTSTSTSTSTSISISASTSTTASSATSTTTTTSAVPSSSGLANSTTTTMRTSTSSRPTASASSTPVTEASTINSSAQLASPLALVFCIFAGLLYLN